MRRQPTPPRDREIAELASRQHGVVGRPQLEALGASGSAIDRRLRDGRLHPVHRGVYSVGHPLISLRGRWMASVLACGPGSLLSHADAAVLWDIGRRGRRIHVTVTRPLRRRIPGLQVHRSRGLDPRDGTVRDRIPVTGLARTLLDLAADRDDVHLKRAAEEAERRQLLDLEELRRVVGRSRGHHGVGKLRRLIEGYQGTAADVRSPLEQQFLERCRQSGLPEPIMNVLVEGYLVDACWPQARLIVELDGYATHSTRAAFERDRGRDLALRRAGWTVVRLTDRQVRDDWPEIARDLHAWLTASPRAVGQTFSDR